MKRIIVAAVALVSLGCACASSSKSDPAPHITPQPGKELCGQACEAMKTKLTNDDGGVGCEEGLPVPAPVDAGLISCFDGGAVECWSCEQFCVYQHENGIFWNTECIANQIKTCAEIESLCNR